MGTLVDSSVLVASKNQKDALHTRAVTALKNAELPLIVHEYVLLETATVLMIRANKTTADEFVRQMLGNAAFSILFSSQIPFFAAAKTFVTERGKLSFTDAALLSLSGLYPVLTFDDALTKAIKKKAAL